MSQNAVQRILGALALVAYFGLFGAVHPALAYHHPGCTHPLAALDPQSLGLDPTQPADEVAAPFGTSPTHNTYVLQFPTPGKTMSMVGVVLPAPGPETYTVSPNASLGIDTGYDVSGCWGPDSAVVLAQPGHYTFLAVATDGTVFSATLEVQEQPGANPACGVSGEVAALAAAKQYAPLAPTVAGNVSGLMIGSIVRVPNNGDGYITASDINLRKQKIQYEIIDDAKGMAKNIDTVYKNNKKQAIVAGEIGHGTPNCWSNVNKLGQAAQFGTDAKGKPSKDLAVLEAANVGEISTFDIFSCDVALGAVDKKGNPVAKHVMTQMATALVGPNNGDATTVRAMNVVIAAFAPSRLHPKGVWLIGTVNKEAVDKKPAGTQVEMTCTNNNGNVTCAAVRTQVYP